MAKGDSLRTIQFDDATRELMQEIGATLRECKTLLNETGTLLGDFRFLATVKISEESFDDEGTATFTFADLHG